MKVSDHYGVREQSVEQHPMFIYDDHYGYDFCEALRQDFIDASEFYTAYDEVDVYLGE